MTLTLDDVLGPGPGTSPEVRARASTKRFVRSLDQLAEHTPGATGRQLSASEALDAYGYDVLREVAAEGGALLCVTPDAAGHAIRSQRDRLGLETRAVAARANMSAREIERAEQNVRDVRLRTYERIARALGMDERQLSVMREPAASAELAVRLRTVGEEFRGMTSSVVSAIAEAAWVAQTQVRLEETLGIRNRRHLDFEQTTNYGSPGYPAYQHGYYLAQQTRQALSLGNDPIPSMRELCEETLGIPVIQADLGEWVAGVTVEVATNTRAIVVNISGGNRDVFMRRSTMAHEVGHLLYDPRQQLNKLRVDEYDGLATPAHAIQDRVEQRANAFAVELLAPQEVALQLFDGRGGADGTGLQAVIDSFGISFTAARYQIWNGRDRSIPLERLTARARPEDHWVGAEQYTVDYNFLQTADSRAGRFSAVVIRAAQERLVSWDTAAEFLLCTEAEARAAADTVRDLFPSVFRIPAAS